jgi:hypothetical protein
MLCLLFVALQANAWQQQQQQQQAGYRLHGWC